MELREFVAEALKQILAGVNDAQGTDNGEMINAENAGIPSGKNAFQRVTMETSHWLSSTLRSLRKKAAKEAQT